MRILYLTHQLLWIPPHVDLQIKSGNRVLSHFDIFTFPVAPLSAEPRLFSQNLSCFFLFISSLCFSHGHGFALPLLSLKRRKMKGLGQREMQTQHSLEKILFVAKENKLTPAWRFSSNPPSNILHCERDNGEDGFLIRVI